MSRTSIMLAAISLLIFGIAPSVMAQEMTPYEIGAGYTALYDDPDTYHGFAGFFAVNMTEKYSIVGEVGGIWCDRKRQHLRFHGRRAVQHQEGKQKVLLPRDDRYRQNKGQRFLRGNHRP